jgi:SAM-dependent methyltransferase
MTHDHTSDEEFWDARYGQSDQIWSGNPNTVLVREVTGLEPGRALDLGCGEGADAIWLAQQGWRVTATDISGVALDRAARHAVAAGVADRVDWQRHDLGASFPDGAFDLVSAQFLHSLGDMPREKILRTAASAVAPAGVLLVVGHAGPPPGSTTTTPACTFPLRKKSSKPLSSRTGSGRCCSARNTSGARSALTVSRSPARTTPSKSGD